MKFLTVKDFSFIAKVVLCCFAFAGVSYAQKEAGGQHEVLRAADGFPIHITYYPFMESKESPGATAVNAPVVVMIPDEKENRLLWDKSAAPRGQDPFPILLQKRGYAVITVDPRKHGESIVNPDDRLHANDFPAIATADMGAVKKFIFDAHQAQQLNMRKLGVIGSGTGAAVAAGFAEIDWSRRPYDDAPLPAERTPRGQDVKALILLSPVQSAGRVKTATSLKPLRGPLVNLALEIIVGADNTKDRRQAESIFQSFETSSRRDEENKRVVLLSPNVKDRGIALMRQPIVYVSAFKFIEENLKSLEIPWQDRRSRLER